MDWSNIFTGIKTVLDPLAAASWPLGLAGVAYGFRKPITFLLSRVKTVSGWGASVDIMPGREAIARQQDSTDEGAGVPATIGATTMPSSDPVFDPLDHAMRELIDQAIPGDDKIKLAWAIRQRSISEANRLHETHYRLIFGSQIKALVALNQETQADIAIFRRFYEENVRPDPANAVIHKDRSFEDWGNFLIQAGYVEQVLATEPPMVRITALGRNFCAWLGFAGVSQMKLG